MYILLMTVLDAREYSYKILLKLGALTNHMTEQLAAQARCGLELHNLWPGHPESYCSGGSL